MEDLEIFDVAIVGGGPAGAYCAYHLAKNGINSVIFDPSHPREKPCGGGLSPEVLDRYPFIRNLSSKRSSARLTMIAPSGEEAIVEGKRACSYVSRLELDKHILDMSVDAGSMLFAERVTQLAKEKLWVLSTAKRKIKSRIVIGADGVHSLVRKKILGPIPKENLAIAIGYIAKGKEVESVVMKYLKDFFGYIWIFPRKDHSSIGLGSQLEYSKYLKRTLDQFINSYCPHIKKLSPYAAVLPSIKNPNFYSLPCSGEDWILTGDAAGHVDPVTGEGIQYAMKDGEFASRAVMSSDLKSFDKLWWREYGYDFKEGCKLRKIFYNPFIKELLIKQASKSRTSSRLLYNIASSEQDYTTYLSKNAVNLPGIILESILGFKVKP